MRILVLLSILVSNPKFSRCKPQPNPNPYPEQAKPKPDTEQSLENDLFKRGELKNEIYKNGKGIGPGIKKSISRPKL